MDTYSASRAARMLGTSAPRVLRAIRRLQMDIPLRPSGAFAISPSQLSVLADELGAKPPAELSRTEARVLAGLARSPRGLASIRSVARRSGVSPTAAGSALSRLSEVGLVDVTEEVIALGKAKSATIYSAAVTNPRWHSLAAELAKIELPTLHPRQLAKTVPYYLRHLFWNTAPTQLDVSTSGAYIAKRLLSTGDLEGLGWGAINLPADAWKRAAQGRGLAPRDRAMALNFARGLHGAA